MTNTSGPLNSDTNLTEKIGAIVLGRSIPAKQ